MWWKSTASLAVLKYLAESCDTDGTQYGTKFQPETALYFLAGK